MVATGLTWNGCISRLLNGDYKNGWPSHDVVQTGLSKRICLDKPVWDGSSEPITLLVNAEFGMGDTIQFFRFLPQVQERVAHIILRCNEHFKRLFSPISVIGAEESLPEFDKVISMMALPHVLGIEDQFQSDRYLSASGFDHDCSRMLSTASFFKVGVCWSGNPFNPRDSIRSIPAVLFKGLVTEDGLSPITLNKLHEPPGGFLDARGFLRDWASTAAIIAELDLVISVDTAIAHLAGALGIPVWLLLNNESPEWRWGLGGETTPWYSSMKIFRKRTTWQECIERLRSDLREHPRFS